MAGSLNDEVARNDGIEKVGQYLLRGWVLTDKNCGTPHCNFPLLRTKDSSQWLCVVCGDQLVNGPSPKPRPNAVPVASPSAAPTSVMAAAEEAYRESQRLAEQELDDMEISETLAAPTPAPVPNPANDVTKKLGQKLLQGWTMLAAQCPNCNLCVPLMRNRTTQQDYCVHCEEYIAQKQEQEEVVEKGLVKPFEKSLTLTDGKGAEEVNGARGVKHALVDSESDHDLFDDDDDDDFHKSSKRRKTEPPSSHSFSTAHANHTAPRTFRFVIDALDQTNATLCALTNKMKELTAHLSNPHVSLADLASVSEALAGVTKAVAGCVDVKNRIEGGVVGRNVK